MGEGGNGRGRWREEGGVKVEGGGEGGGGEMKEEGGWEGGGRRGGEGGGRRGGWRGGDEGGGRRGERTQSSLKALFHSSYPPSQQLLVA